MSTQLNESPYFKAAATSECALAIEYVKSITREDDPRRQLLPRQLLQCWGITQPFITDPTILNHILAQDMRLDGLEGFIRWLNIHGPEDIQPMLDEILNGLPKHRAIIEFIRRGIIEGKIPLSIEEAGRTIIKRMIMHTYLLEKLVQFMAALPENMAAVDRLLDTQIQPGIYASFSEVRERCGCALFATKFASIGIFFKDFLVARQTGEVSFRQRIVWPLGFAVNILEAVFVDTLFGGRKNASAGLKLALAHPIRGCMVDGTEARDIRLRLDRGCDRWYESWNLAFVFKHFTALHVLLPKFFIPSVLNASPDLYVYKRLLSLWVTLHFLVYVIERGDALSLLWLKNLGNLWGEVNSEFAQHAGEAY
jgi:hypothetical protein